MHQSGAGGKLTSECTSRNSAILLSDPVLLHILLGRKPFLSPYIPTAGSRLLIYGQDSELCVYEHHAFCKMNMIIG